MAVWDNGISCVAGALVRINPLKLSWKKTGNRKKTLEEEREARIIWRGKKLKREKRC